MHRPYMPPRSFDMQKQSRKNLNPALREEAPLGLRPRSATSLEACFPFHKLTNRGAITMADKMGIWGRIIGALKAFFRGASC
jgi:hypothetical protein